jgi:hypothetical protein
MNQNRTDPSAKLEKKEEQREKIEKKIKAVALTQ